MINCAYNPFDECLPDILECANLTAWNSYLMNLYDVFVRDFITTQPIFRGMPVDIRREPMDGIFEHTFTHLTHKKHADCNRYDPNDRIPDLRRSERLVWIRKIIENYDCILQEKCDNILFWEEMYRGRVRINLWYKSENFIVILEQCRLFYYIITSFFLTNEWEIKKRLRKYQAYQKQKTPLA